MDMIYRGPHSSGAARQIVFARLEPFGALVTGPGPSQITYCRTMRWAACNTCSKDAMWHGRCEDQPLRWQIPLR